MNNQELITNAIAKMSNEEKALIFPPVVRKNFVVRKSWLGRNQVITFNTKATPTKPSVQVTYNHDEVLKVMLPKLSHNALLDQTRVLVSKYRYACKCQNII